MSENTTENQDIDSSKDNPSICIPRVEHEMKRAEIIYIFNKLKIGKIRRIDIIPSKKTGHFKIFVHFNKWYDNEHSNIYKELLNNGGNFKIVYNFPKYLKCFKSKFS